MRHFIDEIVKDEPIKYADGSQSEALHHTFHLTGHNSDMIFTQTTPFPENWLNWEDY